MMTPSFSNPFNFNEMNTIFVYSLNWPTQHEGGIFTLIILQDFFLFSEKNKGILKLKALTKYFFFFY